MKKSPMNVRKWKLMDNFEKVMWVEQFLENHPHPPGKDEDVYDIACWAAMVCDVVLLQAFKPIT